MTRTLVVGHDAVAGLGCLDLGAVTWFTALPDDDVTFPDPTPYDRVVVLGAPWPRSAMPWIERERAFLTTAHDAGAHVLGICFGAQLVTEVLGGSVHALDRPRIGWFPVDPHDDRVAPGPWFSWHADQLDPPAGSEVLATDDDGVAAFRHGRWAGVQFHPEMTPALLERWFSLPGAVPDDDLRVATARHAPAAAAAVPGLLDALLG
ncbi:type 1 glutamine amidotransferase [Actinomycetospora sp. CA-084318]|uniref:type 1 glutamine amidotransferase n=1 Tax=Actinomycetospora sp. CA-084318 TaxID=3239892 RepID=UPI003D97AA31